MNQKKIAAEKAVEYIKDGMTVGLGTGSTAFWAIQKIGERVKEGLNITAVATSLQTEKMARELTIPIASFADIDSIDVSIDGADEVDKDKHLIKGGGGALLREKIVAYNSRQFLVIADESKLVDRLGKFPLPIEILPFGAELTLKNILKLCNSAQIRQTKNQQPYVTDNGNWIVDADCYPITEAEFLNGQLKLIPGVIETGLFLHTKAQTVFIGTETGRVTIL